MAHNTHFPTEVGKKRHGYHGRADDYETAHDHDRQTRRLAAVLNRGWVLVMAVILIAVMQACASAPKRNPLPADLDNLAVIPGYPENIRYWGDEAPPYFKHWYTASDAFIKKNFSGIMDKKHTYLAVSGGGENGAYGVGVLLGWTATGTRPEFTMVTGISTGALIAPFAFLGPDYDARLKEAYTTMTDKDIFTKRSLIGTIRGDSALNTAPLKKRLAQYVDQEMIEAIAKEFRTGRRLLIGTVNLDAMRPVLWNIGAIAASGREDAIDLIHTILIASASIPGAFPPQFFTVEAKGMSYDEMHVDGGTVHQAFLYPMGYNWNIILKRLHVKGKPEVYIIRNGRLSPEYKAVEPARTLDIAGRAASSLILSSGVSDLYRMYLTSLRDGLNYHWTAIPDDFNMKSKGMFDPVYMQKLLEVGYQRVVSGIAWQTEPPDYKIKK